MKKRVPKQKCTIYIIRHGETDWNAGGIVLGQQMSPKLTDRGIKQAQNLGRLFKRIRFAHAYSSDLKRTVATARLALANRDLKIETSKILRERSYGKLEGLPSSVYLKKVSNATAKRNKLVGEARWRFKLASYIESDYEVFERFTKKLRQIAKSNLGKNVLVVTHGGCIRTFLVGIGSVNHQDLPMDKLLFGKYIKAVSDGHNFKIENLTAIKKRAQLPA